MRGCGAAVSKETRTGHYSRLGEENSCSRSHGPRGERGRSRRENNTQGKIPTSQIPLQGAAGEAERERLFLEFPVLWVGIPRGKLGLIQQLSQFSQSDPKARPFPPTTAP